MSRTQRVLSAAHFSNAPSSQGLCQADISQGYKGPSMEAGVCMGSQADEAEGLRLHPGTLMWNRGKGEALDQTSAARSDIIVDSTTLT